MRNLAFLTPSCFFLCTFAAQVVAVGASPIPPPSKLVVVDGKFDVAALSHCYPISKCYVITTIDASLIPSVVEVVDVSPEQVTLKTTPPATDAAFVYIGALGQPKHRYMVSGAPTTRRQVLSGSFCSVLGEGLCPPHPDPRNLTVTGYIFDKPDGISYPLTIDDISPSRVVVAYSVPVDFTPRSILLSRDKVVANFPYTPAPMLVKNQLVYQAYDLQTLCTKPAAGAMAASTEDATVCLSHITANSPDQPDSEFRAIAMQDSLLFVTATMADGVPPNILAAYNPTANLNKTVLLRRVTRAAADQSLLTVEMTPMDQETVRRDFGMRIAEHYLAVTIDVTNRTNKKLQFNKSAMWFDVDFRAVGGPNRDPIKVLESTANLMTADTVPAPDIYNPAFGPYKKKNQLFCLKRANLVSALDKKKDGSTPESDPFCNQVFYRYGIEQSTHLTPVNYTTALAAFDYTTEKTDRILRFVELLGATLIPISSASIVAQVHNTAFHDSITLFTGTFFPGFRGIVLDPAHINRLRSNLIGQTLQETIAVPPTGFATTIVLLPRDGMLAVRGHDQTVVIDRLVDVHIDADVINGSKDTPVPADLVQIGYTMDQVRQALGEPYKMTPEEASGQTVFGYRVGTYSEVAFNKEGKVIASTQYTLAQQLGQKNTLPEATEFLRKNNIDWTRLSLINGNSILVDIPTLDNTKVPLFDSKDKAIGSYKLLYADILKAASSAPSPEDFTKALSDVYLGSGKYPSPTSPIGKPAQQTFSMPDIVGGYIVVTLDPATNKKVQPNLQFTGSRPATLPAQTIPLAPPPAS